MINYNVKAKKNPVDASVKFYPQIGKQKAVGLEEIAKEISVMCTLSLPDIVSVLSAMQEEVENVLRKGRSVRFGYLGSFRPTIVSKPVETKEDVGVGNIKRVRVRFTMGGYLRKHLKKNMMKFKREDLSPTKKD